jgi:hypothetical protein
MLGNTVKAGSLSTEHVGLMESILSITDSMNQQFELAERTMTDNLSPEQLKTMEEKRFNAEKNLTYLEEALKNHYTKEEEFLRPLLGNLLKEAIIKEVIDILRQLDQAKSAIINTNFKESDREQVLFKIVNIKRLIESLSQQVEMHATKMDSVLKLLQSILESENKHINSLGPRVADKGSRQNTDLKG